MISLVRLSMDFYSNGQMPFRVFDEVNLHIAAGEFVCILGPSGCGKSTLLNLLAGFLKPTSGAIFFDGQHVTRPAPERAVVFQDPTLFPWLTVRGNVEFGLREQGLPARERRQKVRDYLAMVGLEEYEEVHPHALSGGMRQRVALARVLALEPKALLMDEPFSALDVNTGSVCRMNCSISGNSIDAPWRLLPTMWKRRPTWQTGWWSWGFPPPVLSRNCRFPFPGRGSGTHRRCGFW